MDILDGSRNLTQQLTYALGKAIVQGKYQVDAVFPTEADLSTKYNISRSVTREAVKMLTAKGLICSRPRKGIRVQPPVQWNMFDSDVLNWTLAVKPSLQLLKEFTQLRAAIEPEAVALACSNATAAQIQTLALAVDRIARAIQGEDDPLEADIDFHTALLEASNNRFFIQFCDFIQTALRVTVMCSAQLKGASPAKIDELRAIYKYIVKGDARLGKTCMRALLDDKLSKIMSAINVDKSNVATSEAVPV